MINKRCGEPLTLKDLAATASLSPYHFSREFRKVTGVPPMRFLSGVRMSEGKRLLATTSFSVTEIALLVGYGSCGTFTTRFSAWFGMSPTTFRNGCARLPLAGSARLADHALGNRT